MCISKDAIYCHNEGKISVCGNGDPRGQSSTNHRDVVRSGDVHAKSGVISIPTCDEPINGWKNNGKNEGEGGRAFTFVNEVEAQ